VTQIAGSGFRLYRDEAECLCPRDYFSPFGSVDHISNHISPARLRIASMPPLVSIDMVTAAV